MSEDPKYLQKRLTKHPERQADAMRGYYRFHALIYDLTRWTFLFGRKPLIHKLPFSGDASPNILEVGCGTGYNLRELHRYFPKAHLTGLDVSADMLRQAQKRFKGYSEQVSWVNKPYLPEDDTFKGKPDAILFSYSLTMINPQWKDLLHKAKEDLKPGGIIGVVDFHNSPYAWFKAHMANNHVKMEGHLLPVLEELFEVEERHVNDAYLGIWQYLLFVGRKSD